jgi:NADH-quinone oxidoreductase subunit A
MEVADYLPILLQILLAAALGGIIICVSVIFGAKGLPNKTKNSPYECGVATSPSEPIRFPVKFYITAMLFILFDIEVVFLIPAALVFREFLAAGIPILLPLAFFVGILVFGLVYELKKGAIEWER